MKLGYAVVKTPRWLVAAMATTDTKARMLMRARSLLLHAGHGRHADVVAMLARRRLREIGELRRGTVR